jgi:hypothetical protein
MYDAAPRPEWQGMAHATAQAPLTLSEKMPMEVVVQMFQRLVRQGVAILCCEG